jgi:hypothetical protein
MSARSVEDQVSALLARAMVERRSAGVQSSGLEASAVFDSIALNLLLKPRAAFYFEALARNGLAAAVREELALLARLRQDISDCGNPSYKIEQTAALNRARGALLQLEGLPRVGANSSAMVVFDRAIQEFLDKGLAKNVRRKGASDLARPSSEALQDLPNSVQALKTQHDAMLERLHALVVGIENFITTPFAALLGTSIVSRARRDLELVLEDVAASGDPALSRDYAVRLMASRAAIKTISSPPDLFENLFSAQGAVSGTTMTLSLTEDLRDVVQVGDVVYVDAERRVVDVLSDSVELDTASTFSGQVVGQSSLVVSHQLLDIALRQFMVAWGSTKFTKNLVSLDQVTARLLASQSPAQQAEAQAVAVELETTLSTLLNLLVDPSTMLPPGAAAEERRVVEGILATLTERHYDRAVDLLLKSDLQSLLELDQDSASYAGNFLRNSSEYARSGVVDPTVDEEADSSISAGRVG